MRQKDSLNLKLFLHFFFYHWGIHSISFWWKTRLCSSELYSALFVSIYGNYLQQKYPRLCWYTPITTCYLIFSLIFFSVLVEKKKFLWQMLVNIATSKQGVYVVSELFHSHLFSWCGIPPGVDFNVQYIATLLCSTLLIDMFTSASNVCTLSVCVCMSWLGWMLTGFMIFEEWIKSYMIIFCCYFIGIAI